MRKKMTISKSRASKRARERRRSLSSEKERRRKKMGDVKEKGNREKSKKEIRKKNWNACGSKITSKSLFLQKPLVLSGF